MINFLPIFGIAEAFRCLRFRIISAVSVDIAAFIACICFGLVAITICIVTTIITVWISVRIVVIIGLFLDHLVDLMFSKVKLSQFTPNTLL